MMIKSLRSLLPSYSFGRRGGPPESSPRPAPQLQRGRVSDEMIEELVAAAEALVAKWDRDVGSAAVLFCDDHRAEASAFLAAVGDLQRAMLGFVSGEGAVGSSSSSSSHSALVRAQSVMQAAMRRLEKEFHRILADDRYYCRDPEAVSFGSSSRLSASEDGEDSSVGRADDSAGEVKSAAAAAAMGDLRAIAETMIFAGYSKECMKVYKLLRKSVVDEELRRLKFDSFAPNSQFHKLDWTALEIISRSWLSVARGAFSTLFSGERILLEHVFAGCDSIRDAVFGDIANDAAFHFFLLPEAVAKSKRSMDKTARLLNLYDTVSEMLPEVDSLFSFESTSAVREQALASLSKLGETIRATVTDFEEVLMKENSKFLLPGGGVHPLTRRSMGYIAVLADYKTTLAEIFDESHTRRSRCHHRLASSGKPSRRWPAVGAANAGAELQARREGGGVQRGRLVTPLPGEQLQIRGKQDAGMLAERRGGGGMGDAARRESEVGSVRRQNEGGCEGDGQRNDPSDVPELPRAMAVDAGGGVGGQILAGGGWSPNSGPLRRIG